MSWVKTHLLPRERTTLTFDSQVIRLGRMENPEIRKRIRNQNRKRKRKRKRNSNGGKLGNTETSFMVKSFSIYNHKSPKRNIRVCMENYG